MTTTRRATAKSLSRLTFRSLALFWAIAFPFAILISDGLCGFAQAPAGGNSAPVQVRGVINLNHDWRLLQGDDFRWADPAFDDKEWAIIDLDRSLAEQGVVSYTGYGWYRLRLQPQDLAVFGNTAARVPLQLLVTGNSVGQFAVYVNGVEGGHTRGMTERPLEYQSLPLVVDLPNDNSATVTVAIRTWADSANKVRRGLLESVELGTPEDITDKLAMATGRQWNEHANASIAITFLFLCVAVLGAALYIAQRHHSEYLWLAILCVIVAAGGTADAIFGVGRMPVSVYRIFIIFHERVFMAVTVEFVLRFTATKKSRVVRIFQISVLLLPLVYFLHLNQIYGVLTIAAEVAFCALASLLLYRAWRRGHGDAGIMLLPFLLATTADWITSLLNFAASKHWIADRFASHRFHFGPIAFGDGTICYMAFLASLVAVILSRFIRISQEEQRSTAEIAAARSVQALLIPTQLPSNKNFMLESAYLPVNGVGGDFFQVLPLKDDSLLIVVGDVSGKGLQAAMNSSTLVGALRNELSHDPATVLSHLNHVLIGALSVPGAIPDLGSAPCYATCLCARIYPDGTTTIANAGHLSPYRDGRELPLTPSLPLGVIADSEYEQSTFRLNRGDRLLFVSDGVVEATNAEGELFGFERTQQVSHEPPRYIAQTAQRFGQTDDITVLSVYVASRAAERDAEDVLYTR